MQTDDRGRELFSVHPEIRQAGATYRRTRPDQTAEHPAPAAHTPPEPHPQDSDE